MKKRIKESVKYSQEVSLAIDTSFAYHLSPPRYPEKHTYSNKKTQLLIFSCRCYFNKLEAFKKQRKAQIQESTRHASEV